MTRKKANVTPNDVGSLYIDGKNVYRLIGCDNEPRATMEMIGGEGGITDKPISEFANFVRLRLERPIAKPPAPRKPRADKGGSHKKLKPEQVVAPPVQLEEQPETVTRKAKKRDEEIAVPDISTFSVSAGQDEKPLSMRLGEAEVGPNMLKVKTPRECALFCLGSYGLDQKYVEDAPDSEGKKALMKILDATK